MRPKELILASNMAIVTGLSAQLYVYIGPIPYTMQNFGIVLSGLLLKPKYAFLSQLIYLALIAIGLPLAAGAKGGVGVLLGPTAGYLWGFPIAAILTSILARPCLMKRRLLRTWLMCFISSLPVYVLGILWLETWMESLGGSIKRWLFVISSMIGISTENSALSLIVSGMLIFIPQDVLIDHVLAIIVASKLRSLLMGEVD